MSGEEVDEDLRQLSWAILISRDRLLKVAEKLPDLNRERARKTAGKLTEMGARLRIMGADLPEGVTVPESLVESVADLRLNVEQALRELSDFIQELREITGDAAGEETRASVN